MSLITFAFAATGALWNPAMLSTHPRTRPHIARSATAASTPAAAPSSSSGSFDFRTIASEHYLAVAGTQMMIVRGLSDVIAQVCSGYSDVPLNYWLTVTSVCSGGDCATPFAVVDFHHAAAMVDFHHAAAMAAVGLVTSGCGGALWWRHLERSLGPKTPGIHKVAADFTCWAPSVIAANLVLVPMLCGRELEPAVEAMQRALPGMLQWEFCLFVPFNIVLFTRSDLVPVDMRPSYKACLSMIFSTILSLSCASN